MLGVHWAVTGAFTGAAVAGPLGGARLSGHLPARALTRVFAAVVAAVGVFLVAKSVSVHA